MHCMQQARGILGVLTHPSACSPGPKSSPGIQIRASSIPPKAPLRKRGQIRCIITGTRSFLSHSTWAHCWGQRARDTEISAQERICSNRGSTPDWGSETSSIPTATLSPPKKVIPPKQQRLEGQWWPRGSKLSLMSL